MSWEYKTVGGPERGRKRRGARTVADRVAAAMQDIIEAEAVDGWEYLRTDLIAVEERAGMFGRRQPMHCPVLVFRRPVAAGPARGADGRAEPALTLGGGPGRAMRETPAPHPAEEPEPLVLGVAVGQRVDTPEQPAPRPQETGARRQALFLRRDTGEGKA